MAGLGDPDLVRPGLSGGAAPSRGPPPPPPGCRTPRTGGWCPRRGEALPVGTTPASGVLRWFRPDRWRGALGPSVPPAARARVLIRAGAAVPEQFAHQIVRHAQLYGETVIPVGHMEPGTIGQLRTAHGSHLVAHSARFLPPSSAT